MPNKITCLWRSDNVSGCVENTLKLLLEEYILATTDDELIFPFLTFEAQVRAIRMIFEELHNGHEILSLCDKYYRLGVTRRELSEVDRLFDKEQ